jgi:hypothetical protein
MQIDNDITTEHRLSKINTANSVGRKTSVSRKATKTPAKNPLTWNNFWKGLIAWLGRLLLYVSRL